MELSSKTERKVIHFSSGEIMLEEDSEEDETDGQSQQHPVCVAGMEKLTWRAYTWFWGSQLMRKSLQTCDFLGGKFAGLLGLNRAKYQYAIDQYHRDHKHKTDREETLLSNTVTGAYGTTTNTTTTTNRRTE